LFWEAGMRTRGGHERPALGVPGHTNKAQIWTGFRSSQTP
jgi:hypothetical protein